MGLSSSKTKTTAAPYAPATPAIDAGIAATQQVFNSQQPTLNGLAQTALQGYNSIAPAAYSPSPYVQNAQAAAGNISSTMPGSSPGANTYASLMAGSTNPAMSTLTSLANGGANAGTNALTGLLNGGSNSAMPGLASLGYGTGSLGAGDGTLSNFAAGQGVGTNAGAAYDQDVLGGKFLNNNPYEDAMAQQATDAATKAASQRFGAAGLGQGTSSAFNDVVSKNAADASNAVRFQVYSAERANQEAASGRASSNYNAANDRAETAATGLSAGSRSDEATRLSALNSLSSANNQQFNNQLGAASGLASSLNAQSGQQLSAATALGANYNSGLQTQLAAAQGADSSYNAQQQARLQALGLTGSLTDAQYAGINPALNLLTASAQIPYYGVNALGGSLNTLAGQYGTKTTTGTPSVLDGIGQAINIGSSAYSLGSKLSDRRLKRDITRVGQLDNGLSVYSYRYAWGGPIELGVMADEVALHRPAALGPMVNGYSTVDYSKLGAL